MADEPTEAPLPIVTDASDHAVVRTTHASPTGHPADDRLQLRHLLLWITCCAVVFGVWRKVRDPSGMRPLHGDLDGFVIATVVATAILGLVLAIPRWLHGQFVEPGHWLLAAQGACYALGIITFSLASGAEPADGIFVVAIMLPMMAAIGVLGAGLFDRRIERSWRVVLGLAAGIFVLALALVLISASFFRSHGGNFMSGFAELLFALLGIDGILFLMVAMTMHLRDKFRKYPHGWLHRVGMIVTLLTTYALPLLAVFTF